MPGYSDGKTKRGCEPCRDCTVGVLNRADGGRDTDWLSPADVVNETGAKPAGYPGRTPSRGEAAIAESTAWKEASIPELEAVAKSD